MDAELKSFLLQILRNQAEMSSQLVRIIHNLEMDVSESSSNFKDEKYEEVASMNFNLSMQEREIIENCVYNNLEIRYKIE